MIQSMTAFASRTGAQDGIRWIWEMRSVNARGLDLRVRLPDGLDGLEASIRKKIGQVFKRGSINLTLKLTVDQHSAALSVNEAHLDRVLDALDQIQERAFAKGVTLGQPTAADVLSHKGVAEFAGQSDVTAEIKKSIDADLDGLIDDLLIMRRAEGAALNTVIKDQIAQIDGLVTDAGALLEDRKTAAASALQTAMQAVLVEIKADPDRLAQELAILAVKSDITEEIDRLRTHVTAATAQLDDAMTSGDPVGRRLDFLSQEFNREANTLCAKSQFAPLTSIGLDLKTVIDQLREQVQNVE